MTEVRIHESGVIRFSFIVCCLLFTVYFLLVSCGKKGDPTLKSYEKPEPPSGLRAVHRETDVILSWDFPEDKETSIKGFHLMKSISPHPPILLLLGGDDTRVKGGAGDFEKIAFLEPDKRSYVDKDFKIDSEYTYKIISQNLKGIISNDSNIIHVVPKAAPPPPINILFKPGHDSLILKWDSSGDGILYNIYKTYEKGVYHLIPVNKEPLKETSFNDNLDIKRPVFYTIRSLWGSEIKDEGPASEEIAINPSEFVPSAPEGLHSVVTEENVYLIWEEVPETWASGYRVYREKNEEESFIFVGETQTPAFLDKDKPVTKRNYRVTALGPSKESPPAEIRDVIFVPQR